MKSPHARTIAWIVFGLGLACGFSGLLPMRVAFFATFVPLAAVVVYQRRPVDIAWVVMIAILVVAIAVLGGVVAGDDKKIAGWPPSPSYPIVIVGNVAGHHEAFIIYFHELEEAKKRVKEWSFLIPSGEAKALMKKYDGAGLTKTMLDHDMWFPGFEVTDAGPNRQRLEVNGSSDDDETNRSWYEAQDKDFTPLYYASSPGGPHFEACGPVLGVFVAWLLVTIVVVYYVNQRQRIG